MLVAGTLPPEQRARVADHAATCRTCHELVNALVTQHGGLAASRGSALTRGSVVGGRFRIDDVLGVGGMGIVVAATHLELGTRVAMKFMRDEMLDTPVIGERFVREARAVVRLRTEHVCRVLDIARLDSGAPYIVMELLEGVDLARAIVRNPLPMTIAVEYIMQACVALAEAHALGIVHRDLKPGNLFVTRGAGGGPLVKVLDFGIAKAMFDLDAGLTLTRAMLGSPGYMSPEQLESARHVDARTDVWALGVTLYQLLSGRMPFVAPTLTAVAVKIAAEPPAALAVDGALAAVVLRCLEKAPANRYPDVVTLAADLVPFGGPSARRIAAAVAAASRGSGPGSGPGSGTTPAVSVPGASGSRPVAGLATAATGIALAPGPMTAATGASRASGGGATSASVAAPHGPVTPLPFPPVGVPGHAGLGHAATLPQPFADAPARGYAPGSGSERALPPASHAAPYLVAAASAQTRRWRAVALASVFALGVVIALLVVRGGGSAPPAAAPRGGSAVAVVTVDAGPVQVAPRVAAPDAGAAIAAPASVAAGSGHPAKGQDDPGARPARTVKPAPPARAGRSDPGAASRPAPTAPATQPETPTPVAPTHAAPSPPAHALPVSLTTEELVIGARTIEPRLIACAQPYGKRRVTLRVWISVGAAGGGRSAQVEGADHGTQFEECLTWVVRDGRWPATRNGGMILFPLAIP